ncbi:MAG: hypothetical protein VKJ06_01480 [Vampirovibrionales bacterium]|nr:hypothetical protein [Vampirovibrionales bacterium]
MVWDFNSANLMAYAPLPGQVPLASPPMPSNGAGVGTGLESVFGSPFGSGASSVGLPDFSMDFSTLGLTGGGGNAFGFGGNGFGLGADLSSMLAPSPGLLGSIDNSYEMAALKNGGLIDPTFASMQGNWDTIFGQVMNLAKLPLLTNAQVSAAQGNGNSTSGTQSAAQVSGAPPANFSASNNPTANRLAQIADNHTSATTSGGKCFRHVAAMLDQLGLGSKLAGQSAYMGADQLAGDGRFEEVKDGSYQPGDVIVYGPRSGNDANAKHGHIEVVNSKGQGVSDFIRPIAQDSYSWVRVFRVKPHLPGAGDQIA